MISIKKLAELTGHSGAIYSLEQDETEHCFYSGSSDKIVAKWNLDTLSAEKFAAQVPAIVYSLCHVAEKNALLTGTSEGKIHVLDLAKKKEIKILQNHIQPVFDLQYSSQNKIILSAGGDGALSVLSGEDFSAIKIIKLCPSPKSYKGRINEKLRAIDIRGNEAAVACGDGMIRIIDLLSLKVSNEFSAHKDSVYTVKFSPSGKILLSGGKDAHLKAWFMDDVSGLMENTNSKLKSNFPQPYKSIPAHNYAIYSIVFRPDGKLFATASRDKTIKIWNATTFEMLVRINKENFDGHVNSVNKLLWKQPEAPSLKGEEANTTFPLGLGQKEQILISTGDDRKIMVWKIE